jgi:adenylate kinase family enzyme
MRLAVSGTYSSGKTTTSIALAHLTGIPHASAKTMREILPEAIPGKRLEECTTAQLIQLGIRRFVDRAVHESRLGAAFISDGSSLHEWAYGKIRVQVGIHPDDGPLPPVRLRSGELDFFEDVIDNMGAAMKQHAQRSYDAFVHLPIEFPLVADGHRPVSERFRALTDRLIRATLDELRIPYHVVGGTLTERLEAIVELFGLPRRMPVGRAVERADEQIKQLSAADEIDRQESATG